MYYTRDEYLRCCMIGMGARVTTSEGEIWEGTIRAISYPNLELKMPSRSVYLHLGSIERIEKLAELDFVQYVEEMSGLVENLRNRLRNRNYRLNTWICLRDELIAIKEKISAVAGAEELYDLLGDNEKLSGQMMAQYRYDSELIRESRDSLQEALKCCTHVLDEDEMAFVRAIIFCTHRDQEEVMRSYLDVLRWEETMPTDEYIQRLALKIASHAKMMGNDCGFVFFTELYLERFGRELISMTNPWWLHYIQKCSEYQRFSVLHAVFRALQDNASAELLRAMYETLVYLLCEYGRKKGALEAMAGAMGNPLARMPAELLMYLVDDPDTLYCRYRQIATEMLLPDIKATQENPENRMVYGYVYDYVYSKTTAHIVSYDLNSYYFNRVDAAQATLQDIEDGYRHMLTDGVIPEEIRVTFRTVYSPRSFNHIANDVR